MQSNYLIYRASQIE